MTTVATAEAVRIPVGMSSCLLGEKVRFDGQHQLDSYIEKTLMKNFLDLPVEKEGRLGDSVLRENFIQRVSVLQHMQGSLKQQLDADDKAELSESIAQYLRGQVPLFVPITLLTHHFRRNPND